MFYQAVAVMHRGGGWEKGRRDMMEEFPDDNLTITRMTHFTVGISFPTSVSS